MISVDFQGSALFPHILALCFNRKVGDQAKITGIAQLLFQSLAFICQARHDMNDVICHVGSIFCVNKRVARQNKLYFPL